MTNPTDPKTREEIEDWRLQETCRAILGSSLQPSDSHDGEEDQELQPLMTEDAAWYFVPRYDDPVPLPRRIGPVGRQHSPRPPRWGIEVITVDSATRDEPESYDLVEIDRVNSLEEAFCAARYHLLEQELADTAMAVHAQYERKMEPFIESYMTPTE